MSRISQLERVVFALIESQESAHSGGAGTPLDLDDELIGEVEEDWFKPVALKDIDSDDIEEEMEAILAQLEPEDEKDVEVFAFEIAPGDDPIGYLVWLVDHAGDQGHIILDTDGVVVESGASQYELPLDVLRREGGSS